MTLCLAAAAVFAFFMAFVEDSTCYLRSQEVMFREAFFIPKVVMQTHYDFGVVPPKVAEQFERLAPDFERVLFDDEAAASFIRKHYSEETAGVFESFSVGAFKADFFRYCYLYVEGGIYLDIKTELVIPLHDIYEELKNNGTAMATCLTDTQVFAPHSWFGSCAYQGIIFARPRHPIFLECLAYMKSYAWRGKSDYLTFCRNFIKRLHERGMASPGVYEDAGWTLWSEKVSVSTQRCMGARSKLGVCSVIENAASGETLFITRFEDFPWGKRR
jgi:hypothetical protein